MRVTKQFSFMLNRFTQMAVVLFVIATILFLMFRLMPGNPLAAYIDPTFTEEQQEQLMRQFGLDKPLYVQYLIFLKNLGMGQLGQSFFYRESVSTLILRVLPNTLLLTGVSLLLAYLIGVVGGVILAYKRGTLFETLGVVGVLMTRSAPQFWTGMIALAVFSFSLGWFPASGATSPGTEFPSLLAKIISLDFWKHMILPAAVLSVYLQGLPLLLMRSSMLEVMNEDFVMMSRMKGLPEWVVMFRHAARNALLPVLTALALGIGYAIGGNVVIETVFGWPGVGRLLVRAVAASDYPLAQGAFFVIAVLIVVMNFVADLMYVWLDPRVSYR